MSWQQCVLRLSYHVVQQPKEPEHFGNRESAQPNGADILGVLRLPYHVVQQPKEPELLRVLVSA